MRTAYQKVVDFLEEHAWTLLECCDLGTTAHTFIVEKDNQRSVLKVLRTEQAGASTLSREYQLLCYLMTTPMRPHVPALREWLPDLNGFVMEYLRPPTPAEQRSAAWVPNLARTISTLHNIPLPAKGMPAHGGADGGADDRPDIGAAIGQRFQVVFQTVLENDRFWAHLSNEDAHHLDYVRDKYADYRRLLPLLSAALRHTPAVLTHGDLSGDNILLTQDGQIALADWGAARISAAVGDVAYLLTYTRWPEEVKQQFLQVYHNGDRQAQEEAAPALDILTALHRYRSCVQSLLWLNDEQEGLDAVGRAHFEHLLRTL